MGAYGGAGGPVFGADDWGETLAVSGVDVGASVEEEDGDVWVPRVGGEVEGRAALAVRVADTFGHQASRTARWRMPSRRVSGGEGSGDGDRGGAARGATARPRPKSATNTRAAGQRAVMAALGFRAEATEPRAMLMVATRVGGAELVGGRLVESVEGGELCERLRVGPW